MLIELFTMGQLMNAWNSAASFLSEMVDDVGRRAGLTPSDIAPRGPQEEFDDDDREVESGLRSQLESSQRLPDDDDPEVIADEELEFLDEDPTIEASPLPDFEDDSLLGQAEDTDAPHQASLSFIDTEAATEPSLRPTRDSIGDDMARAMLTRASGGSTDDDAMDGPTDPLAAPSPLP